MGVPKNFDQKRMKSLQKSNIETEDFKNQINLFTPTNTTKIKTNDKKVIKKKEKENVLEFQCKMIGLILNSKTNTTALRLLNP
jgi:hypothetical protein